MQSKNIPVVVEKFFHIQNLFYKHTTKASNPICKTAEIVYLQMGKESGSHRVVCLVNADEEDELGEEERCHKVLVDAVQVGAELLQDGQQDEGDQQSQQ